MSPSAFSADDHQSVVPAVLGPEHFGADDLDAEIDPEDDEVGGDKDDRRSPELSGEGIVIVPTATQVSPGSSDKAEVQLRRTDQGSLALPVYTSIESLVACCGEDQPWVAVRLDKMAEIVTSAGADGIVTDMALPHEHVRTTEGD